MKKLLLFYTVFMLSMSSLAQERGRARDFGVKPGILETGALNAITDVEGVKVGHKTLVRGDSVRTGVTVIVPHEGNLFQEKWKYTGTLILPSDQWSLHCGLFPLSYRLQFSR